MTGPPSTLRSAVWRTLRLVDLLAFEHRLTAGGDVRLVIHRDEEVAGRGVEVRLRIIKEEIARADREVLRPLAVEEVEDFPSGHAGGRVLQLGPVHGVTPPSAR
jgi:hypothetical protein